MLFPVAMFSMYCYKIVLDYAQFKDKSEEKCKTLILDLGICKQNLLFNYF